MTNGHVLDLARAALADLERGDVSLVTIFRKAIRVARLRNDWEAVYWLSMELDNRGDKAVRARRITEVAPYFTQVELRRIHVRVLEESLSMRAVAHFSASGEPEDDKVTGLSVPELEDAIVADASFHREPLPSNLHPLDAATFSEQRRRVDDDRAFTVSQLRRVRARLEQRVHSYLSVVESQLARGQQQADYFDHNRAYVDRRLSELSGEAKGQLEEALRRAMIDSSESRSHALTSCRRALKSLADLLYPPRDAPVLGPDGKERLLTDSKFVSRIWQYLAESAAGSDARKQMQAEVEQLGGTVDRLYALASKGVHDEVTTFEVSTCVLSLYGVAGALLRIHDAQSATAMDAAQLSGQ